jgi:hypothetical protein
MQSSPILTTDHSTPSDERHETRTPYSHASSFSNPVSRPLSPPMFIDVSLDDFSSSVTEAKTSLNGALSSATTTDASAQPQSPETGMSYSIDQVSQRGLWLNNNSAQTRSTLLRRFNLRIYSPEALNQDCDGFAQGRVLQGVRR